MRNVAINLVKQLITSKGIAQTKRIYNQLIKLGNFLDRKVLALVVNCPFLCSFYYALISSEFRRETQNVIYGKLKYYKNLETNEGNSYLLRRNIHRLEKGLIMQPRRDIFGLDYIEEILKTYLEIYNYAIEQEPKITSEKTELKMELQWAHDVLKEYFSIVSDHPTINTAREIFESINFYDNFCGGDKRLIPYKRDLNTPPAVSYDQFLQLCYRRRSVRWYEQKLVPRELVDQAITAAALSPSACNRQPFEFRVFDTPELVQEVASIPGGTHGFYHNFPVIVVVIGKLSAYFSERDRHLIYIDSSLASMSLMYALETLGLSSCSINWPDINDKEEKMKSLLQLDTDERPIMLISVGFPDADGMVPYSQKKTLDQIRKYNL